VRRIEAVTGEGSLRHFRKDHELEGVVAAFADQRKDGALRREVRVSSRGPEAGTGKERRRDQAFSARTRSGADEVGVVEYGQHQRQSQRSSRRQGSAHRVDNLERAQMRTLVDQLRDKLGSAVVVLGSASNGNVSLIVGVTKDLTGRIQAGKVIGPVAQKVGGKGGGRPDLAEAGGKDASALDSALGEAYSVVESLLG
jgi:alanyl-tRNA synthetase